jgi:hypothetical protein
MPWPGNVCLLMSIFGGARRVVNIVSERSVPMLPAYAVASSSSIVLPHCGGVALVQKNCHRACRRSILRTIRKYCTPSVFLFTDVQTAVVTSFVVYFPYVEHINNSLDGRGGVTIINSHTSEDTAIKITCAEA